MSGRRVAVVVLNWNGWRDSVICLNSLRPVVTARVARIIVVDNASTDDSVAKLREWLRAGGCDSVELTENEILADSGGRSNVQSDYVILHAVRNSGYAAGNNLGIHFALGLAETEYVFVLNNDTRVEPDCIPRLAAHADRDPAIGIVGPTVVEDHGKLRIAGGNKYSLLLTKSTPAIAAPHSRQADIDYVAGAAQFIRATALRRVGLLSEDYFLYFEELDFTRRVTKAGFKISWCPDSIIHHECGRATGSRSLANKRKSALAEYHSNLSCLIFLHKFHPRLLWLAAPTRFMLKILHDLLHRQPALVIPLVRAYRDYLVSMKKRHA